MHSKLFSVTVRVLIRAQNVNLDYVCHRESVTCIIFFMADVVAFRQVVLFVAIDSWPSTVARPETPLAGHIIMGSVGLSAYI